MQEMLKRAEPAAIPHPEVLPEHVRYIKLGPGGVWASHCIEKSALNFGSADEPHELCLAGAWDEAKRYMVDTLGRSAGSATDSLRELRDFYQLPANTLWVTFHDGHLWWTLGALEQGEVQKADGPYGAVKRNVSEWSNVSRLGTPLRIDLLSTRLTKVAAYQRTICNIDDVDYLLRKINHIEEPSVAHGRQALEELIDAGSVMVARLHEREFELLADLMLTRLGWGRISALGGPMPDVDSIVLQGATGERGFVQVKSRATQAVLDDYVLRFDKSGLDRMFFICHSPKGSLAVAQNDRVHVWSNRDIAEKVVSTGLFEWLMERVR
jgi:hypothetical protein